MDHPGPLARTVRDTAAIYAVMADFAASSPTFPADWKTLIEQPAFPPPRLAELAGVFQVGADAEMLHGLMLALEKWINGGAFVESITLPGEFEQVLSNHKILMAKGAANYHKQRFAQHPNDYQPAIASLIEEGLSIPESDWQTALDFQQSSREMMLSMFAEVDALITPASVGPAPDASTTGNPVMNSPWSFCGFPTLTFPIGLSEEGLPLGVQIIGKPGEELALFQAALWCESVIHNTGAAD
jgi:aspartyl-tRNA(Asn)/glutamyl-tRNA(Gln) amidotransferase subunit A